MPSILFHELVGYKFAKKYKKYDTPNFYLGLMVPDAVNAYGFASKEKRWSSHFRDENLDKWQENILNFYNTNYNKYEHTYLMGYLIHVLTDIICDKIYQKELYPQLLKKGFDYDSAYTYYEEGIRKLESSNINEQWWNEVKLNFEKAEKIPINSISEKMIQDWIDYTINKYNDINYEDEEYITMDFVNEVLDMIEKIISNNS